MELDLTRDPVAWLRAQPLGADAVQARVLEALARRASAASSPLREELLRRLQQRIQRLAPVARAEEARVPTASPLAALLAELAPVDAALPELRSLSTQRRSWAGLSLQRRLNQAPQRAPAAQVGPLNADALVPRALARLQALSPDYLQRLVAQVDALAALAPMAVADAEPARAGAGKRRR